MVTLLGTANMYPQNWLQGEKSDFEGSVILLPLLSVFLTGVWPGLCDQYFESSIRIQWKSAEQHRLSQS